MASTCSKATLGISFHGNSARPWAFSGRACSTCQPILPSWNDWLLAPRDVGYRLFPHLSKKKVLMPTCVWLCLATGGASSAPVVVAWSCRQRLEAGAGAFSPSLLSGLDQKLNCAMWPSPRFYPTAATTFWLQPRGSNPGCLLVVRFWTQKGQNTALIICFRFKVSASIFVLLSKGPAVQRIEIRC